MSESAPPTPVEPSLPNPDEPPAPRALPRQILPRLVRATLLFSTLIVGALYFVDLVPARSFIFLGMAAILGIASSLLWKIIEAQRDRPPDQINAFAWVAFPGSLLLFFAQMPLLALAIYPPIAEFFEPHGHVRAYYVNRSSVTWLDLDFPLDLQRQGNNLRLDDTLIPPSLFTERSDLFEWRSARIFSLKIDQVERELGIDPVRSISVNSDTQAILEDSEAARAFLYAGGERVQPITLDVEGYEERGRRKAAGG
jgi:hypothetical protein